MPSTEMDRQALKQMCCRRSTEHRACHALDWIVLWSKVFGAKVTQVRNASMRGAGGQVALAPLSLTEASACAVSGHENHGWSRVPVCPERSFPLTCGDTEKPIHATSSLSSHKKIGIFSYFTLFLKHLEVLHTYNLLQKKSFIGLE